MSVDSRVTQRLAQILLEEGILKAEDLNASLEIQRKTGERLGKILIKHHYATEEAVAKALQEQLSLPYVDIGTLKIEPEILSIIPAEIMEQELVLPLRRIGKNLTVAAADPLNQSVIDTIRRLTGCSVDLQISTESAIRNFLREKFGVKSDAEHAMAALKEEIQLRKVEEEEEAKKVQVSKAKEEAAAVVRLVDSMIKQAIYDQASDVHIEPSEDGIRVRYRRDGILETAMKIPKAVQEEVIVRIKILSGMDISERRRPQDGHFNVKVENRMVDLRISSFPGVLGEKIVVRILDQRRALLYLEDLGFSETNLRKIEKVAQAPYGLFLITGPTGSGKTTTLYALLHKINKESLNILTIEDPVEYRFPTITQLQVNPAVQLDFVDGLRSALRQDPDIILVGEIRDEETLKTAIQASITGHLVLSTLHTNNALLAFPRMVQLGVPTHLILSGLLGMMAQRLVRKLCPHCRKSRMVDGKFMRELGFKVSEERVKIFDPVGCEKCHSKGYLGRTVVAEVILVNNQIRSMLLQGIPVLDIQNQLIANQEKFLVDDALDKIFSGATTLEEVLRVVKVGEE